MFSEAVKHLFEFFEINEPTFVLVELHEPLLKVFFIAIVVDFLENLGHLFDVHLIVPVDVELRPELAQQGLL